MVAEDLKQHPDIADTRRVLERQRLLREQRGDHQRQSRILGARDRNSAFEPLAADDTDTIHYPP